MTDARTPLAALLARAGGVRGLVYTALPVTYLYDTGQAGLLAIARIAMGWPVFVVTSSVIYFAIRVAIRGRAVKAAAA